MKPEIIFVELKIVFPPLSHLGEVDVLTIPGSFPAYTT